MASGDHPIVGRRLPPLRGTTLARRPLDLPADLEAPATLLLVAFRQRQQADVDTWLPLVRDLAGRHPGFAFYEVPLIGRRWRPLRGWIDGGMRAGIPDPAVRATTLTVYASPARFLGSLGIDGDDAVVALLLDSTGVVRWAALGPARPGTEEGVAAAVEALTTAG